MRNDIAAASIGILSLLLAEILAVPALVHAHSSSAFVLVYTLGIACGGLGSRLHPAGSGHSQVRADRVCAVHTLSLDVDWLCAETLRGTNKFVVGRPSGQNSSCGREIQRTRLAFTYTGYAGSSKGQVKGNPCDESVRPESNRTGKRNVELS